MFRLVSEVLQPSVFGSTDIRVPEIQGQISRVSRAVGEYRFLPSALSAWETAAFADGKGRL